MTRSGSIAMIEDLDIALFFSILYFFCSVYYVHSGQFLCVKIYIKAFINLSYRDVYAN